jgi:hypothetical protein
MRIFGEQSAFLVIGADKDEFVVLIRLEGPLRVNQCSTLMLYGQNG